MCTDRERGSLPPPALLEPIIDEGLPPLALIEPITESLSASSGFGVGERADREKGSLPPPTHAEPITDECLPPLALLEPITENSPYRSDALNSFDTLILLIPLIL